jgi:cytochrome P450
LLEHGSRAQEGSLLALLREHDPEPASHAQRVDDLVTLLLAGHDTLTNALTWTWLLLASHPDVEARLHAELSDVLRGRAATIAELPALVYTKAVLA